MSFTGEIDKKIGTKYIAKNNTMISNNYFNVILSLGGILCATFFLNASITMMIIGGLMIPLYIYLYKKKDSSIITSVTVYSYQLIFMEIIFKSFKINKDFYKNIKLIFNNKK